MYCHFSPLRFTLRYAICSKKVTGSVLACSISFCASWILCGFRRDSSFGKVSAITFAFSLSVVTFDCIGGSVDDDDLFG